VKLGGRFKMVRTIQRKSSKNRICLKQTLFIAITSCLWYTLLFSFYRVECNNNLTNSYTQFKCRIHEILQLKIEVYPRISGHYVEIITQI